MIIKPGFYESLSNEDYHGSDGFSRSQLKEYGELPEKFYYKYLSGLAPKVKGKALDIGSAFHVLVQEPHLFNSEFAVIGKIDKRTKEGKKMYAEFEAENKGKIILLESEYDELCAMRDSVFKNKFAADILNHPKTQFETSIFWEDKETGLTLKCRPDMLVSGVIGDLKSTKDASPREFQYSCTKYDYYMQAGMMSEGLESIGETLQSFLFVICEKARPYSSACYFLSDEAIEYGVNKCKDLTRRLAHSLEKNDWPGYEMQEIDLPNYLKQG